MKKRLVIVTTVPETLATILKGQPSWLSQYFDVSCITSPDGIDTVQESESVPVYPLAMTRGISPMRDIISILKMWRLLVTLKPDIVHSYTPKAGLVAMTAAYLAGVTTRVHTFTGLIFPTSKGLRKRLVLAADRLISSAATHVVPEGEGVKNDLYEYEVTKKTINVIGHGNIAGVDLDYFKPDLMRDVNHTPVESFTFCYIGRLNRDKGIKVLVSAFLDLKFEAQLLMAGSVDTTCPLDDRTFEVIKSHPRISFLGFQNHVRDVLLRSDVLVLPSFREGFPNVVLQAGAMCKPVIASNINGCNEVIVDGWNGWLVSPRDVAGLAEAMKNAFALDRIRILEIGCNARKRIEERFDREVYLEHLLSFYKKVSLREF